MRPLLCFCFLFFSASAIAQQTFLDTHIGWKAKQIETYSVKSDNAACIFLLNKDSVKAFYISDGSSAKEAFTVPKKKAFNAIEKYVGAFIRNNKVYLFMDNATYPGLHSWMYDMENGSIKESTFLFEITKEKIIGRISSPGHFFYLATGKKQAEFVIYHFKDEMNFDTIRYRVQDELTTKINRAKFMIAHVSAEGECPIGIASFLSKSYVNGSRLLITFDEERSTTKLFEFDLDTKRSYYRWFKHNDQLPEEVFYSSNSYVYGDKLYYTSATDKELFFEIRDFNSGEVLQQFRTPAKDSIGYKNTPIIQEGGRFKKVRELTTTSQLLNKMTNGRAAISAYRDSVQNQTQITIGAFKPASDDGIYIYTFGFGAVGAIVNASMITAEFMNNPWDKATRFKVLYDHQKNAIVPGEISMSINDRIADFSEEKKIKEGSDELLYLNGNYYYTYYDKEMLKFFIVRIR